LIRPGVGKGEKEEKKKGGGKKEENRGCSRHGVLLLSTLQKKKREKGGGVGGVGRRLSRGPVPFSYFRKEGEEKGNQAISSVLISFSSRPCDQEKKKKKKKKKKFVACAT